MSQYAYLDATGVVLAVSTVLRTVSEVQVKLPSVVERVDGAPDAIRPMVVGAADPTYHQKISGDGTSIGDYAALEELTGLKLRRYDEIDARSQEMIELGFVDAGSGEEFSLSRNAQINWLTIYTGLADMPYPIKVSKKKKHHEEHELSNQAAAHAFVLQAMGTAKAILDNGRALRIAIGAATTQAAVNAIVDTR